MEGAGIVRGLDGLGRLVIPADMRKELDMSTSDTVEVFLNEDSITVKKYNPRCVFCGKSKKLKDYKFKKICPTCLENLGELKE